MTKSEMDKLNYVELFDKYWELVNEDKQAEAKMVLEYVKDNYTPNYHITTE